MTNKLSPAAWGKELDDVIIDVICPTTYEWYNKSDYTVPLYALSPEQVVALENHAAGLAAAEAWWNACAPEAT